MPLSSFFRGASAISGHSRSSSQPLSSSGASLDPPAAVPASANSTEQSVTSDGSSTTADLTDAGPTTTTTAGGGGIGAAHVRSYSHTISNPTSFASAAQGGAAMPSSGLGSDPSHPPPPPTESSNSSGGAGGTLGLSSDDDIPLGLNDTALVRRYHTLSTGSGSRLARLEKRQALSGMAEEDRRFYGDDSAGVSPIEPGPDSVLPPLSSPPRPQAGEGSPRSPPAGFQVLRAYKDGEAQGGETSGNAPLYSHATVQRNVSHPTRLQTPASPSSQPPKSWGPSTGRMGAKIVKSDSLRRRMAGMSEGAADRSGNWRVKEDVTAEEQEDGAGSNAQLSTSVPSDNGLLTATTNLHRAASDRAPGPGHQRSFSNVDSTDPLRRHQSLRAGGRWGASPALPSDSFPGAQDTGPPGSKSPTSGADGIMRRGSLNRRGLSPPMLAGHSGPTSPGMAVPGFMSGPWSPTAEEAIKLREPTMVRRSGSGENLDSPAGGVSLSPTRKAPADGRELEDDGPDLGRLQSAFARMEMTGQQGLQLMAPPASGVSLTPTSPGSGSVTPSSAKPRVPLPPLVTNFTVPPRSSNKPPSFFSGPTQQGPQSAAPYVNPIGHSLHGNGDQDVFARAEALARAGQTAGPGIGSNLWRAQKELLAGTSQSAMGAPGQLDWGAGGPGTPLSGLEQQLHQQMLINQQLQQLQQLQQQQQILQQQQAQLLSQSAISLPGLSMPSQGQFLPAQSTQPNGVPATGAPVDQGMQQPHQLNGVQPSFPGLNGIQLGAPFQRPFGPANDANSASVSVPPGFYQSPVGNGTTPGFGTTQLQQLPPQQPLQMDVQALAQRKGYNPPNFNLHPPVARFFVIKSYTEEDVHKSLKYEIWASTDLGNKRLDKAFKESAENGPIYLFFSVNASGHFCGMAQMLTAVDYQTNSTVWAQDKWKGIFKVKWIFVKDVPNSALRHIRLNNTPENKPVTSSRDTQEVPHLEGLSIMQIISSFQSRTTLLQDFDWYDQNEQKKGGEQQPTSPIPATTGATLEPAATITSQRQHKTPSPSQFGTSPQPSQAPYAYAPGQQQPSVPIRRFAQQQQV